MEIQIKHALAQKKSIDIPNRRVTAWASVECIDRDNEVILASAWKHEDSLADFAANPVGLVGHDYSTLPVFKVEKLETTAKGLKFVAKFFNTDAGREAFDFVAESGLASFSVGFIPVGFKDVRVSDLAKLGIDISAAKGDRVRVYDHVRLLEISLVSIPANPQATALGAAYAGGKIKGLDLRRALDTVIRIKRHPDVFTTPEQIVAFLKSDEFHEIVKTSVQLAYDKAVGRVR